MNYRLYRNEKLLWEFKFPILELRELEDRYIVLLEIPMNQIYNENVLCISKDGKLIWRIEYRDFPQPRSHYQGTEYNHNQLIVYNLNSFSVHVDIDTGRILRTDFTK